MRPRINIPRRSACQSEAPPGASPRNDADERLTVPEFFRQHVSGACEWILEQERLILKKGIPLTASELGDARLASVAEPGRVRLLRVETIPIPAHSLMRAAAQAMGLNTSLTPALPPATAYSSGPTFGDSVGGWHTNWRIPRSTSDWEFGLSFRVQITRAETDRVLHREPRGFGS